MNKALQKIAMVDDHNMLRAGLATVLNTFEGFEVVLEANNGREFIDKLQTHPHPDIILLDIHMPVMNGYETAEWIKKNLPTAKILVITMLDSDLAIIKMLNFGVKGFVFKDSHPDQLRKALIQLRDKGICLDEFYASRYNPETDSYEALPPPTPPQLSEKEVEFLKLVSTELTYREIAEEMGVSPRTVDSYRDTLFKKLHVISRVGLVLFAVRNGIVMM
ncbi:response regulator transcription factor [Flavihumibacter solisilvae]|uniref:Ligand-binding protein SH3 n=1 Tax=Flavihumibacter solisilvae TaxID=1349421 RepID=A0A0C1J0R6_9BACT|nr:response regulator transcription factor [Flavihumibacter solisilvae]KIC96364.1 hypothetical protein OI18_00995 [Flavihumibacter solisilvae]